jgi:hypothetical protein
MIHFEMGTVEMSTMISMLDLPEIGADEPVDRELRELVDRVRTLPQDVREGLEPVVADVLVESRFRSRILMVARDAIERLRLDLEATRFDLDATRRDRQRLELLLDEVVRGN